MQLGELEYMVLLALARLDGEGHGVAIARELEVRADRRIAPGALYTVLDRLQRKGCVEGWIGDSTPARGGRRRKVYRLLPLGAQAAQKWYGGVRGLARGADHLLAAIAGGSS